MEPTLLTTEQASELMGMGITRSLNLLRSHGVQPVDLGRGRGNGLRWHRRAVMTVIDTLHAEAQAKAGVPRRRRQTKKSIPDDITVPGTVFILYFDDLSGVLCLYDDSRMGLLQ